MNLREWIKDFLELAKIIAWPLVVYLLFQKFQTEIRVLINEIKLSFSFGDKKLELSHKKAEALQQLQEESPNPSKIKELEEENKKHKDVQAKLLELQENTASDKNAFFLGYHFEKTYRLIFGSQLSILKLANQYDKLIDDLALSIYKRTTWATSYPYNEYIGFLINSGLIGPLNPSDQTYSILPVGKAFIGYLAANNLPLNKQPY